MDVNGCSSPLKMLLIGIDPYPGEDSQVDELAEFCYVFFG
jgi:hypothetical protein